MKKLLFCATWAKMSTGYGLIAHMLVNKLARDYDVHYLAFQATTDDLPSRELDPSIKLIKSELFGYQELKDVLSTVEPDVMVVYNDVIVGAQYTKIISEIDKKFQLIYYVDLTYRWQRNIYYMNKEVDMFVCFHPGWERHMLEMGIPREKVCTLEHPIADHVFPKMGTREVFNFKRDDFIVLNLNRNSYRKCLDVTIDGFIKFWKNQGCPENIKLFLGCKSSKYQGSYKIVELVETFANFHKLSQTLKERLMNQCVLMPGGDHMTDRAINDLYNACDVGINTCCGEGFGLCTIEHQLVGKPQIVTGLENFRELMDPEFCIMLEPKVNLFIPWELDITGGLMEIPCSGDVARALETYYLDPELRKRHGEMGRDALKTRLLIGQ